MQCLEDCNIIPHLRQITGTGQAGGAGTDHRYFLILLLFRTFRPDTVLSCPVSHETLQLADRNRLSLNAADTLTLTLALLRADTAAYSRKGRSLADDLIGCFDIAFLDLLNKSWNINRNRTSLDTLRILTINTTGGLPHCLFFIISQTYFFKICRTYLRILFTDRYFLQYIYFHLIHAPFSACKFADGLLITCSRLCSFHIRHDGYFPPVPSETLFPLSSYISADAS